MTRLGTAMALGILLLVPVQGRAAEYFSESDDYKDGEAIVNVFLKEDDYRMMVEDIERNGETFDWGWVKTGDAQPASEEPSTKRGKLFGKAKRGGPNPAEPKSLGFNLGSYKTVSIPEVQNFSGLIPPELQGKVRESFSLAMAQFGLAVVPEGSPADLEVSLAIVDVKRDSTYIYFGNLDPFIELELRLKDLKSGENLILLRNQTHSATPEDAAFNYASTLLKFLR